MITNSIPNGIKTICTDREDYNLTPKYQRDTVWTVPQQRKLIDTILKGWEMPKIYLRAMDEDGSYEVIDGQQRLRAIFDFRNGEFSLEKAGGRYFENLTKKERKTFLDYRIDQVLVSDATEAEVWELYSRLQNGVPLNEAEKRHAIKSSFNDFVQKLVEKHPFFTRLGFNDNRYSYEQLAAQLVSLGVKGMRNINNTHLESLYLDYVAQPVDGNSPAFSKFKRDLNTLAEVFPAKHPALKKYLAISAFILVQDLSEKLKGREEELGRWILDYDDRIRADKKRDPKDRDPDLSAFREYVGKGSDTVRSLLGRHNILVKALQKEMPDLFIDNKQALLRDMAEDIRHLSLGRK